MKELIEVKLIDLPDLDVDPYQGQPQHEQMLRKERDEHANRLRGAINRPSPYYSKYPERIFI